MADIFTTSGEGKIADIVEAANTWYIAWGTDGTTAVKGDTSLTEPGETRVSATMTQPSANVNQFDGEITATATRAIQEAGVFDAISSGTMLLSSNFATVNLSTDDSIAFTFTLTWS